MAPKIGYLGIRVDDTPTNRPLFKHLDLKVGYRTHSEVRYQDYVQQSQRKFSQTR